MSKSGETVLLTQDPMLVRAPRLGGDFRIGGTVVVYDRESGKELEGKYGTKR